MAQSRGSGNAPKQNQSLNPPRSSSGRSLAAMRADDEVEFAEAVELLASRVPRVGDSERQSKDKIGQRLRYALRRGEIVGRGPESKTLLLGDVAAWASAKWPGRIDLPLLPIVGVANVTLDGAGLSAEAQVIPGNLAEIADALQDALKRESRLISELSAAQAEIGRLSTLANMYEENIRKNRESARRPRTKR